ncbi:MAG: methylated-DNA--[protein]-cysteine S-methyltransferase [Chloroflexi bacterium]|nr:methylated-DNA--[protein]-cysteine S-methyltransferase [Chloroflexota bacterium]
MINIFSYRTDLGNTWIAEEDGYITRIFLHRESTPLAEASYQETAVLKEAYQQLTEYLNGTRQDFTLPLKPQGTPFQIKVWYALLNIPYGNTASYQDVAITIGNERAARAIGSANRLNPLPIFLPCHRVIGKNGSLVGYSEGLHFKTCLLELERK